MIQLQVFSSSQVNELKEEKKKLQEEMETRNKELKETKDENSSSSDRQETSGDIDVVVNAKDCYIRLRNMSDQDKPLGGRQLKVQINNSEPITYTFDPSMKLKTKEAFTICHPDCEPLYVLSGDLVWEDLKSWKSGDRVQASLQ
ncbi:lamin-A-like [Mugil cephalus]|uniref:lamin-A-like n=1 Tax=Mugil cephalus TaxID=48193 RepID=UPI001FB67424|nr:lamin-A-like [Mugil cephalus]